MVGRFVEHHDVGLLEQDPDEVDPAPLASRERRDVGQQHLLRETETVGQPAQLALDLVAASQSVTLFEGTERRDPIVGM